MTRRLPTLFMATLAPLALGCIGTVGAAGDDSPGGGAGDPSRRGPAGTTMAGATPGVSTGATPGTGTTAPAGAGPTGPSDAPGTTSSPTARPPAADAPIRRLLWREYLASITELVGGVKLASGDLPSDDNPDGFDTNAELQTSSARDMEIVLESARRVAEEVFAAPARIKTVMGCDPAAAGPPCLQKFITDFGLRAYRRPLAPEEVDGYLKLASVEPSVTAGAKFALQTFLAAPSFLFRPEIGVADPAKPGLRRLTGYERATRLAFLLTGATPKPALLEDARTGRLDDPAALATHARTMLASGRGKDVLRRFVKDWLRLSDIRLQPDINEKPVTNNAVISMKSELERLFDDFVQTPAKPFLDVFSARYTYVNKDLAPVYGREPPLDTSLVKVDLPPERAGFMGLVGLLYLHGRKEGSAIWRGKFVRQKIMCQEPPPPPPDVPSLEEQKLTGDERARLEQHRKDPACGSCHRLLDPIGFGLSRFTPAGLYKATDAKGAEISDAGEIVGIPNGAFRGEVELTEKLRALPQTSACVARQLSEFALGRPHTDGDAGLIQRMTERLTATGDFQDMLLAFIASDAFLYLRRPVP